MLNIWTFEKRSTNHKHDRYPNDNLPSKNDLGRTDLNYVPNTGGKFLDISEFCFLKLLTDR
jgi:hypothetical protein